jgi:hypothetical protein
MKHHKGAKLRPEVIEGASLHYAPQSELGVVFLFAGLYKKYGLTRIDMMRPQFPGCIAYQKTGRGEKRVRIEFVLRAKNFKIHKHSAQSCDWLVCWEDNWPDKPRGLRVVELRREFGLGRNVWIRAVSERGGDRIWKDLISSANYEKHWSIASKAHRGDLVLFYRTSPDQSIADVFVVAGGVKVRANPAWKRRWGLKETRDYMAPVRRVCKLKAPLFLSDMKEHPVLKTAGFMRGRLQGSPSATEFWPILYKLIVGRNPSVRDKLAKYAPEQG